MSDMRNEMVKRKLSTLRKLSEKKRRRRSGKKDGHLCQCRDWELFNTRPHQQSTNTPMMTSTSIVKQHVYRLLLQPMHNSTCRSNHRPFVPFLTDSHVGRLCTGRRSTGRGGSGSDGRRLACHTGACQQQVQSADHVGRVYAFAVAGVLSCSCSSLSRIFSVACNL